MGIPVLKELSEELKRIYAAGSPLASNDARLKKYVPVLQKMGEKAPVFNSLNDRLNALVNADTKASPAALMEAGMLLYALRYTQGSTGTGKTIGEFAYAAVPLKLEEAHYSRLHELINFLDSQAQTHSPMLKEALKNGSFRDPRLYRSYVNSIGDKRAYISAQVEDEIFPAIGKDIIPFIEAELDLKGSKRHARLFRILKKLKGQDIIPLAEKALEDSSPEILAEAIEALGQDTSGKYEELLVGYTTDKKADIRTAAYNALYDSGSPKIRDLIIDGLKKGNIGHLEQVLVKTQDAEILDTLMAELKKDFEGEKPGIKSKTLIRVIACRKEKPCVEYLAYLFSRGSKDADKKKNEKLHSTIDVAEVLQLLLEQNDPAKDSIVFEYSRDVDYLYLLAVDSGFRVLSPDKLYKAFENFSYKAHGNTSDYYRKREIVSRVMELSGRESNTLTPDDQKTWDRRWASLALKWGLAQEAFYMVYNDDASSWDSIMKYFIETKKKNSGYYDDDFLSTLLIRLKEINHPRYQKYADELVKAGFDKSMIEEPAAPAQE